MAGHSQFYITLPSSTFNQIYPNNTLAKYTTPLKENLDFTSMPYEVALVEISARTHIFNHAVKNTSILSFKFDSGDADGYLTYEITIPAGYYRNTISLIHAINERMGNHIMLNFLKIGVTNLKTGKYHDINEIADTFHIDNEKYFMTIKPRRLADESINKFYNHLKGVQFSGISRNMFEKSYLDFTLNYLTPDCILNKNDFPSLPQILYIYSDIVEHQIIGNTSSKLLRSFMIPVINDQKYFHHEFTNLHYIKVESSAYKTIDIYIRDVSGNLASFADGELLVKLHFRPINNE